MVAYYNHYLGPPLLQHLSGDTRSGLQDVFVVKKKVNI